MYHQKTNVWALALGLCAALCLLGGCTTPSPDPQSGIEASSAQANPPAAMGRYVEETAAWPDDAGMMPNKLISRADGTVDMITTESTTRVLGPWSIYTTSDAGATWTKRETPWLDRFGNNTIVSSAYDKADNLYLIGVEYTQAFQDMMNEAAKTQTEIPLDQYPPFILYRCAPDGTVTEVPVEWEKEEDGGIQIKDFVLADSGHMVVSHYSCLVQYDLNTGQKINTFVSSNWPGDFVTSGNALFVATQNQLQQFDLSTGEEKTAVSMENGGDSLLSIAGDAKSLFRCDSSGIYRYVLGGSMWERIVDGELTSLDMPSVRIRSMAQGEDSTFLVITSADGRFVPIRLRFAQDVPTVPTTQLKVYSLEDNSTMRQTIGVFQRDNMDTRVSYQAALQKGSAITASDALRTLNTELLAGKGPDVLILDGLPIESYLQKGVLADLSALDQVTGSGQLLQNVADTFRKDGVLYAIPTRFAVPQMWGPDALIEGSSSLTTLADWVIADHESNPDVPAFFRMRPDALIEDFYYTCAPAWKKEDGSLDPEAIKSFLSDIKRIADTGKADLIDVPILDFQYGAMAWYSPDMGDHFKVLTGLSQTADDFEFPDAVATLMGGQKFALMAGQIENVFVPQVILGISKNTSNQEIAQAFIETALSQSVQDHDFSDGYAVRLSSLKKGMESPYFEGDDGSQAQVFIDGQEKWIHLLWPSEAFMQSTTALLENLSTPSVKDPVLMQILIDESRDFFLGNKGIDETVSSVVARAQAYLDE